MMSADKELTAILDLGKALLTNGATVWEAESLLRDIFEKYEFEKSDIVVTSSYLYVTVRDKDDKTYTQVRNISGISRDMNKLNKLLTLSHEISIEPIDTDRLIGHIKEITGGQGLSMWVYIVTNVIGAGAFAAFYNGDLCDVIAAAIVGIIVAVIRILYNNKLASNVFSSFVMKISILLLVQVKIGHDPGAITSSCLLLLISSLGMIGGIRSLLHGYVMSGITDFINSLLAASGIAIGILLAMYLMPNNLVSSGSGVQGVVSAPALQTVYCCIGCSAFARMFGAEKKAMLFSNIGALLTWGIYLLAYDALGIGLFLTNVSGAAFVAVYSRSLSRLAQIPATVLSTTCIFPLLPGSYLYRVMVGIFTHNSKMFSTQGKYLFVTSVGIAVGFVVVEVLYGYAEAIALRIKTRRSVS